MKYLSVCSGIEAATVAWHPIGFEPVGFAEIEKFPSAVLAHRYPGVPNFGDLNKYMEWDCDPFDILVGGTPCQSFSVAGLRAGLADPRGNLALTYVGLLARHKPRWFVWENVPGVLSIDGGRAFGSLLGAMAQLGYGFAYRVLDAQYVRVDGFARAVPQRRRRVFVVGYLGDWRRAAAVLFDRESLLGNPAPRREARQSLAQPIANSLGGSSQSGGFRTTDLDNQGAFIPSIANPLTHRMHKGINTTMDEGQTMVAQAVAFQPRFARNGRGAPDTVTAALTGEAGTTGKGDSAQCVAFDTTQITSPLNYSVPKSGDACHPLASTAHVPAVAFTCSEQANGFAWERDVWQTLDAQVPNDSSNIQRGIRQGWMVRRLTPVECERLQGFPDGYTEVPWRTGPMPDGPRYKALGNSMAVNVMRWIGRRIELVEAHDE